MSGSGKRLGFIGLGMMGYPMASRLHQAGHSLIIFDVAEAQVDKFVREHTGAAAAENLEAYADVEVLITMLPDSDTVESTLLGKDGRNRLIDRLPSGAVVIDMGSSQPIRSRALAQSLEREGLHFLDAPVSGGVKGAVGGTLTIMVGGDETKFREALDVLHCMGKTITFVGGPGTGHALKALNNYVSAAGLIATVEALIVGQEFGLDAGLMIDIFNSSTGQNYTTLNKAKQYMLSSTFNSGFSLRLMTKDIGTASELGESLGWDMSLGQKVKQICAEAASALEGTADHTEMYRHLQSSKTA